MDDMGFPDEAPPLMLYDDGSPEPIKIVLYTVGPIHAEAEISHGWIVGAAPFIVAFFSAPFRRQLVSDACETFRQLIVNGHSFTVETRHVPLRGAAWMEVRPAPADVEAAWACAHAPNPSPSGRQAQPET